MSLLWGVFLFFSPFGDSSVEEEIYENSPLIEIETLEVGDLYFFEETAPEGSPDPQFFHLKQEGFVEEMVMNFFVKNQMESSLIKNS